jgi:hypothetical protein
MSLQNKLLQPGPYRYCSNESVTNHLTPCLNSYLAPRSFLALTKQGSGERVPAGTSPAGEVIGGRGEVVGKHQGSDGSVGAVPAVAVLRWLGDRGRCAGESSRDGTTGE